MKKRISAIFLALVMAVSLFSVIVSADMGPKDSVIVSFKNMGVDLCYCTFLSDSESTGPYSVWDGPRNSDDIDIDTAFSEYRDTDGFYYLHYYSRVGSSKTFSWNYYPPQKFKVLLYYPSTNTFAVSEICDHYAFSSFYTVDMKGIEIGIDGQILTAKRTYSQFFVVFAFIMRVIITAAIEVALALPFGFRKKKQITAIIIINVITQLLLNLILYRAMVDLGSLFILLYIPLEVLIFIVEAVIYVYALRDPRKPKAGAKDCVLYSFLGNFASLVGGGLISIVFPWVAM